MKEYFVMVVDNKPVGQQMANYPQRAELLFKNKTGISAKALNMNQFAEILHKINEPLEK